MNQIGCKVVARSLSHLGSLCVYTMISMVYCRMITQQNFDNNANVCNVHSSQQQGKTTQYQGTLR
jgi:hypothetical protein